MLKAKQVILSVFMIIRSRYFHDRLIIVTILAPGRKLFSAKCAQLPVTFTD